MWAHFQRGLGRLRRRSSGTGTIDAGRRVRALFDEFDGLSCFRRSEKNDCASRWEEWRQPSGQDQLEHIERPRQLVIVVCVEMPFTPYVVRLLNGIKMRVNDPVSGVNMLERRYDESQSKRKAREHGDNRTHSK